MVKYKCLSIVSPNGTKIAEGQKTIEVRSWQPSLNEGDQILIIENDNFLLEESYLMHFNRPIGI